ncbi:MAG: transporter ATP-binding protein [Paenibacillus sp.]|jgi:ABC-2 type transport system ATP-binding protein|nr:transporter ATP-binding protein [Paenibacillus sp.]
MTLLLSVKELTRKFGATTAVNGISFDIEQGRCIALIGPNGAGKTTTLSMLAGLLAPSSGSISFAAAAPKDIRQWIGFLPQHPSFFNWMSGREFLEFSGRLAFLSAREARQRSTELLEAVGLTAAAKRKVGGYSGGMKQRLGIAQALIHRPKLLMLDEPVSALDPIGRREVLELMRSMKHETTLLFSTHVLHDADEISDDIILMQSGGIAVSGNLQTVRNQYRKPLIRIQSEQPLTSWLAGWEQKSFIESIQSGHTGGSIEILIKDTQMDTARAFVCQQIAERAIPVQSIEFGQSTLEQLFMQVVGGESKL